MFPVDFIYAEKCLFQICVIDISRVGRVRTTIRLNKADDKFKELATINYMNVVMWGVVREVFESSQLCTKINNNIKYISESVIPADGTATSIKVKFSF